MNIKDVVFVWQMKEETDIKWHSRYHSHSLNQYEMHYFIQGSGSFRNGPTLFRLAPGSLFITAPGVHHGIVVDKEDKPISYYAVLMEIEHEDTEIKQLLSEELNQQRGYNVGTNYRFFFEEIKEKGLSENRALRQSAIHQLISFLYILSGNEEFNFSSSHNSHIEKALRIMQNSVEKELDLDTLAGRLGLNRSYFVRLFKQKMNITPMKYFMKLRIEAAGAMLCSTDRTLQTIANDLNFYSEFHFSRVFKEYTGKSPSIYRKTYRQEAG